MESIVLKTLDINFGMTDMNSDIPDTVKVQPYNLWTVNCPSQEIEETTRPAENVALTTKGLQERKQ